MSLHLDHRPATFEEFIGNRATIGSIKSKLDQNALQHSIIFQGPTGCGKTTLARILKNYLNCSDIDFKEFNASNTRGIDTAREIGKGIHMRPMEGEVRIYLLDEVHQATKDFQNAILKPLEDTPAYAYFILCTTDPQKLLKTIRNRCAIYEVRLLNDGEMENLLEGILEKESKNISDDAFFAIIDKAEGCPRQALVMLDQIIDLPQEQQEEAVRSYLSTEEQVISLCRALYSRSSWPNVQKVLNGLTAEPESVRRAVIGYGNSIAMREANTQKIEWASTVFEHFRKNFFDTGKAGLTFACWNAVKDLDINY